MGVRFLESYLEKNSSAFYQVNIPDIIRQHREETGQEPVVLLSGSNCPRVLYRGLNWVTGGQYKECLERMDRFIDSFTKLGCHLVAFFSGSPYTEEKIPVWKENMFDVASKLSEILHCLDQGDCTPRQVEEKDDRGGLILPTGLQTMFFYALSRNKNCTVITTTRECDVEICDYAVKNKCLAILAQNTKFVIYRAAQYYLSLRNLDLETMTTYCYSGDMLARELGFPVERLPLFASLLGNEIVSYNLLKDFHRYLRKTWNHWEAVKLVGRYVGSLNNVDLSSIAYKVFGQRSKSQLLEESISSYNFSKQTPCIEEKVSDKNWQDITELTKKKCTEDAFDTSLYKLMIFSENTISVSLESYDPKRVIIPVGTLLKELRRAIYGILLKEKPLDEGSEGHYVKELVMTGYDSLEDFVQVKPKYLEEVEHPGLIALWTCGDEMQETRWKILAEVFTTEADKLKQLPPYFLVPALATRYFKMQYEELKEWEVDALISCNVCVRHYESRKLADLPADPLTYRQIWIYSVITRMYHTISQLVFYIGEPIPFQYVVPHQYTDGKLFHEKYRQASQSCPQEKLLEHQVENTQMFNLMKAIVMG